MKTIIMAALTAARLRLNWLLPFLKKVAKAFSPGLAKLGEILVISGAAALGLKGADGGIAFLNIDFSKIDLWWAIAVIAAGLFIWALAVFFSEKEPCDKRNGDE